MVSLHTDNRKYLYKSIVMLKHKITTNNTINHRQWVEFDLQSISHIQLDYLANFQ